MPWDTKMWIVFFMPFMLVALAGIAWLFLRNTFRTRLRMDKQLRKDPDIPEWLTTFNWSRKILYVPTILVSLVAAILVGTGLVQSDHGRKIMGGIWLAVFFVNFLIDEYEVTLKILVMVILLAVCVVLWLMYLNLLGRFNDMWSHLNFQFNAGGYLIFALIIILAIAISWIKGLFYYVAITPNYLNVQHGPTETGEQTKREDWNTRIDTSDFLERMLGFGRIIVTFRDSSRPQVVLLVSRIGNKAKRLESLRGIIAVDRPRETARPDETGSRQDKQQ